MRLMMLILGLTLTGCPAVCESLQSRCAHNVVEVCDSHGQWQPIMNCDEIGSQSFIDPVVWSCGYESDSHTCVEVE